MSLLQRQIVAKVDELTFLRWERKKQDDGFKELSFGDYLKWIVKDVALSEGLDAQIEKSTRDNLMDVWIDNFRENLPYVRNGKTIAELVPVQCLDIREKDPPPPGIGTAIVIGRGPSIFKKKHLELLASSDYKGTIIASDGMLINCLRAGVIPDYTVSIDGNREKIWKLYDDPLVDKFGSLIKGIINVTCAPTVRERCERAGMEVFWFNPIFDDPWHPNNDSFTRIMAIFTKTEKLLHGVPSMSCGGHCGATAWVLAWQLFRCNPVCLIGIDLGYLPGTPIEEMEYYPSWRDAARATGRPISEFASSVRTLHNPDYDCDCLVDSIFDHYGYSFRQLVDEAPLWVDTHNCTEGGQLCYPARIKCRQFAEFLQEHLD